MKITANYERHVFNEDGDVEITFKVHRSYLTALGKLDKERLMELDIKDKLNQRTLEQNRLLWSLLADIDTKESGLKSKSGVEDLYKRMIEEAMIQVSYMKVEKVALPILKNAYRVVDILKEETINGVEYISANLYKGSSDFNKEEMKDFIETILNYAGKQGIILTHYEKGLR